MNFFEALAMVVLRTGQSGCVVNERLCTNNKTNDTGTYRTSTPLWRGWPQHELHNGSVMTKMKETL